MSESPDSKHAERRVFDARPHAVTIVLGSGIILFLLAGSLQAVAWDAPYFYGDVELPVVTKYFVKMFGLRPHTFLSLVTLWFWWPMVASLMYCLSKYGQSRDFGIAFVYWMALCWMLAGIGLGLIAFVLSLPRYILLANVEQPPNYMYWVPTISWCLPVCVIAFTAICMWRYRCLTMTWKWGGSKEKK